MELSEILQRVDEGRVVPFTPEDRSTVLEAAEIVREDRTAIAGSIRTLRLGDRVLVQERTPKGELYVRMLASEEAARRFVQSRLDAYERMWDG